MGILIFFQGYFIKQKLTWMTWQSSITIPSYTSKFIINKKSLHNAESNPAASSHTSSRLANTAQHKFWWEKNTA